MTGDRMNTFKTVSSLCFCLLFLVIIHAADGKLGTIRALTIASSINPVTANFITEQIELANRQGDAAILIQLDTPGGLDSAMRSIIQAELQSEIPVIVFVAPHGARAASAGALITLAADFAAMAPGTNMGAAHPVAIGFGQETDETMTAKVENDAAAYARSLAQKRGRNQDLAEKMVRESVSVSATEALKLGLINLIANDAADLLKQLHGASYQRQDSARPFSSEALTIMPVAMSWQQQILDTLSNPNIAYMLMMLGIVGIFFEISQPGVILPGVIGTIAILLALFAFSSLPVNYVGVLLILLAIILFILEIKVISYGMLSVGGLVSMALGSLMLIEGNSRYLHISRAVIAATVCVSAAIILLASWLVIRTQRRPVSSGQEGMIGESGRVVDAIDGEGRVFVHGEYWFAKADEPLAAGTEIIVEQTLPGLCLQVRRKDTSAATHPAKEVAS